jgi:predicted metal-dependent enzyme (double-stranded beta helix superfamily)
MRRAGQTAAVSPQISDIHAISCGLADRSSLGIHVHGGNTGCIRRAVYDAQTGAANDFIFRIFE